MKKYFCSWLLVIFVVNIYAHQPDVSTTLFSQQANNHWVLQVKAALTAFKHEIATSFPDETYTSPEEFQMLVIRHVKENISIVFDANTDVEFKQPFVKIGHETNVIFEVVGVPEKFSNIRFKNSSFKDIYKNQSALVILKNGFSQEQFILNNANNHTIKVKVKDAQFVAVATDNKNKLANPFIVLGLAGIGVVGLFLFLKKNKVKPKLKLY